MTVSGELPCRRQDNQFERDGPHRPHNDFPALPRMTLRAAIFLCLALLPAGTESAMGASTDQTDTKIKLMSDALTARDAGDFALARQRLETLLGLVPADAGVKRLLAEVSAREV